MTTDHAANEASRTRMRQVAERLRDTALPQPMGNGWTIAAAFAHLAFLDRTVMAPLGALAANRGFPAGR